MRKKTLSEFLVKAKRIHGDYYDYSEVVYINSSTKVQIICPEHGIFFKTPQKFTGAKQGCPECGGRIKWAWGRFVQEARRKHGNKFDYPEQLFTNTRAKYKIICPVHGEFSQSIQGHLRGGCNLCAKEVRGAKQRDTKEEFIEKAVLTHGADYDYSKVDYYNSQTKVSVICPNHGVFIMKPNNHIGGQGCPECGRVKAIEGIRLSFETAFSRFRKVHGETYQYIEESYVDYTTKMNVICPVHGGFEVTPHSHVSMQSGCRECGILRMAEKNRFSFDEVLLQLGDIHGDRYEYDEDSYVAVDQKLRIKCLKHGWFSQKVSMHKMGSGCPECSYELIGDRTRVTVEDFIEQSRLDHGDKYDYSKVEWIDQYTEVLIGCNKAEHGFYLQVPRDHKRGSGCPRCNESRGERAIYNWLEENDIQFLPQHTFSDLKHKRLLRCDFYLPDVNMVIEYNGVQHYVPIEVFGGAKTLIKTQHRDRIKKEYCIDNGIHYEVIRFDESVDERLSRILGHTN